MRGTFFFVYYDRAIGISKTQNAVLENSQKRKGPKAKKTNSKKYLICSTCGVECQKSPTS